MTINNRTDLPLTVKDIRMAGVPEERTEALFKTGGKLNLKVDDEQQFDPKLIINSYGRGDVIFGSKDGKGTLPDTSLLSGFLEVHMNKKGGSVRTEYNGTHDSFISANSVVIDGARDIGESSSRPLRVFGMNYEALTEKGITSHKAVLQLDADRRIFAELVPVLLYENYKTPAKAAVEIQSLSAADTVQLDVKPALVSAWSNAKRDELKNYDSGTERNYQHVQGHDVDVEIPSVRTRAATFLLSDPAGANGNAENRAAVIRSKDRTYVEAVSLKTNKNGYTGKTGEFRINRRSGRQEGGGSGGSSGGSSGGNPNAQPGGQPGSPEKTNTDYQKLIEQDADSKAGGEQKLRDEKADTSADTRKNSGGTGNQTAQLSEDTQNAGKFGENTPAGTGNSGNQPADKGRQAADLFRNVEKDGMRYLLKADYADPENSTNELTAAAEKGILALTGAVSEWNMLRSTETESRTDGGRMRLVTAGAGLALLIFLLLTRRRRKEEEEG